MPSAATTTMLLTVARPRAVTQQSTNNGGEGNDGRGCIDKNFRKNISPKLKFEAWKL